MEAASFFEKPLGEQIKVFAPTVVTAIVTLFFSNKVISVISYITGGSTGVVGFVLKLIVQFIFFSAFYSYIKDGLEKATNYFNI